MASAKYSFLYFFSAMLLLAVVASNAKVPDEPTRSKAHRMLVNYFQASISFEPNWGQTNGRVRFIARGSAYNLFLTPSKCMLSTVGYVAGGTVRRLGQRSAGHRGLALQIIYNSVTQLVRELGRLCYSGLCNNCYNRTQLLATLIPYRAG
jgi:hypothetical protein